MNYGFGDILTLLGSLGLFLYGMKVMSDALMKVAGDKMRTILATMTANRFYAVLTGFMITSVIQSSSATTLMVVSFANASLLTLVESVGVIMGANIGTTVTAWLITILGFKVSMSTIALPLVGLGFIILMSKKKTRKDWGYFIIGFAILFIGLQFLKDSVPDIKNNPGALEFLAKYTELGYLSVLLFLIIGTVLTLIVQSSSATMALTLVMCNEGWIPFDMAAAMVLGENIGTTITANLAAIVANYKAKRTARAHLIFNIMGVIWMMALFYPFLNGVDWFVSSRNGISPFVEATAIPVAISVFHTAFNIFNTLLLIGLVYPIAKLVEYIVPERIDPEKSIDQPMYLNDADLDYPQTGLVALYRESARLFEKAVYKVISHGIHVHRRDVESEKSLKEIFHRTELMDVDIDELYYKRIKSIFNKIVEFATNLQSNADLNKKEIKMVRNFLVANRHMVSIVKDMKPLNMNMTKYIDSDNFHIKSEYDGMRKIILKVIREINEVRIARKPEKHIKRLQKLRDRAKKSDVLMDGSINKLVRKDLITNEMATSLMNDSSIVSRIVSNLLSVAELLYIKHDMILEEEAPVEAETEMQE
ncbi:MAG: Na/Pi cotransporter family protein [Saprospiraceae bacterium]|nr:Na/Pi cotransporter family protein [Saprospiraceae bacterium]